MKILQIILILNITILNSSTTDGTTYDINIQRTEIDIGLIKTSSKIGHGTPVYRNGEYYILTAAHVVCYSFDLLSGTFHIETEITYHTGHGDTYILDPTGVRFFGPAHDIAMIPSNLPIDIVEHYPFELTNIPNEIVMPPRFSWCSYFKYICSNLFRCCKTSKLPGFWMSSRQKQLLYCSQKKDDWRSISGDFFFAHRFSIVEQDSTFIKYDHMPQDKTLTVQPIDLWKPTNNGPAIFFANSPGRTGISGSPLYHINHEGQIMICGVVTGAAGFNILPMYNRDTNFSDFFRTLLNVLKKQKDEIPTSNTLILCGIPTVSFEDDQDYDDEEKEEEY